MANYVESSLFKYLNSETLQKRDYGIVFWIVGAKGVGKSTTLLELQKCSRNNSAYLDLSKPLDEDVCSQLYEAEKSQDWKVFYMDNIELLPSLPDAAYKCIRSLIKCISRTKCILVAASSRYGLKTLVDKNVVSLDEIRKLLVLSPEEDVARSMVERIDHIGDVMKEEILDKTGGVPYNIITCSYFLENSPAAPADLEPIIDQIFGSMIGIMERDYRGFSSGTESKIYLAVLSVISLNKAYEFRRDQPLRPQCLPWTFLKSSDKLGSPVRNVEAVSKLASDAARTWCSSSVFSLKTKIQCLIDLAYPRGSNLAGDYFEEAVLGGLQHGGTLKYFCQGEDGPKEGEIDLPPQCVVIRYPGTDISKEIDKQKKAFPHSDVLIYACHAKGFDFAFLIGDETHAIQVTTSTWVKKCSDITSFSTCCKSEYQKYLITCEVPSAAVISRVRRDARFKSAFANGLRVVDPTSILEEELWKLFYNLQGSHE